MARKVVQEDVDCQRVTMSDQKKRLEVKGADHRSAKTMVQEGVGCQKVMMVERMAEKVEMADWHQTKMMEARGADYHLAPGSVPDH